MGIIVGPCIVYAAQFVNLSDDRTDFSVTSCQKRFYDRGVGIMPVIVDPLLVELF